MPELGPSITVPDQTMSMRVLLDRHARGMPLDIKGGIKKPVYNNGEVPDLTNADLSEIAHLKRDTAENITRLKTELFEQKKAKEKAFQDAQNKKLADLQAKINSLENPTKPPPIS